MRGETDDELAAEVGRHIAEAHPVVGKLSRDDIPLAEIRARASEDVTHDRGRCRPPRLPWWK
jgi:hypothetical protein